MKRPPFEIKVPLEQAKPGDEFKGYYYIHKNGGRAHCFATVIISADGTPLIWGERQIKEEILCYTRDLTWEEQEQWYIDQASMDNSTNQINLMGLHHDLYSVGDASHEMWNAWVSSDWHEQLVNLMDEDFYIVGIAPAPFGCWSINDPVAIVAEDRNTGDRFWCHASQSWIDYMRDDSLEEYNKIMGKSNEIMD